jgi:hypothetical protein
MIIMSAHSAVLSGLNATKCLGASIHDSRTGELPGPAYEAIRHQNPPNNLVQSANAAEPPGNWARARDAWARRHTLRIVLGVAVLAGSLWATVLFTQSNG